MIGLSRAKRAAQDAARRANGQFGNQEHSMPERSLGAPREVPNPRKGLPLVRTDTADGVVPIIEFDPRDRKWTKNELAGWQYAGADELARHGDYWKAVEAAGEGEETEAQADLLRLADAEDDARLAARFASVVDRYVPGVRKVVAQFHWAPPVVLYGEGAEPLSVSKDTIDAIEKDLESALADDFGVLLDEEPRTFTFDPNR